MENQIHYFPFTQDAESIHEYKDKNVEVIGELYSTIKEGISQTQIYVGIDEETQKIVISQVLFRQNEVVSLKRCLFFVDNLQESFDIKTQNSNSVDAENPQYYTILLRAKPTIKFFIDEISITEISKEIAIEPFFSVPFDKYEEAEKFVNHIKNDFKNNTETENITEENINLEHIEKVQKELSYLLTQGVWEVNPEKTFALLEQQGQALAEYKNDMLEMLDGMIAFFREDDKSFRIANKMIAHEGNFLFEGTNIVHLFGGEIPLKIEVKEINEHIFIFDFQNSTYFAEKLTKL